MSKDGASTAATHGTEGIPPLYERLIYYAANRCDCGIKTAEFEHHRHGCLYRLLVEAATALRSESVICKHEPFEGRCIHCNAPFVDGHAIVTETAASTKTEGPDDQIDALLRFYDVRTLSELVKIQAEHIERLQKKLPAPRDTEPRNYRRG